MSLTDIFIFEPASFVVDANAGELKWDVDTEAQFEGKTAGGWGYADRALIVDALVICASGGPGAICAAAVPPEFDYRFLSEFQPHINGFSQFIGVILLFKKIAHDIADISLGLIKILPDFVGPGNNPYIP